MLSTQGNKQTKITKIATPKSKKKIDLVKNYTERPRKKLIHQETAIVINTYAATNGTIKCIKQILKKRENRIEI